MNDITYPRYLIFIINGRKEKAVHRRALQITLAFIDKYTLLLKNVVI